MTHAALKDQRIVIAAELCRLNHCTEPCEFHRTWASKLSAALEVFSKEDVAAKAASAMEGEAVHFRTGVRDKSGREICAGDRIVYRNESPNTKREYWNPEYSVEWHPPMFKLRHVGGGKSSDSATFTFHYAAVDESRRNELEVIQSDTNIYTAPPPQQAEKCGHPSQKWTADMRKGTCQDCGATLPATQPQQAGGDEPQHPVPQPWIEAGGMIARISETKYGLGISFNCDEAAKVFSDFYRSTPPQPEAGGGELADANAASDAAMLDEIMGLFPGLTGHGVIERIKELLATHPTPSPGPQGGGEADLFREALRQIAEYKGNSLTPVRNSAAKSAIARAALSSGQSPEDKFWEDAAGYELELDANEAATPPAHQPGEVGLDMIERAKAAAMAIQHNKEPWFPMTDRRLKAAIRAALAPKEAGHG